MTWSRRLAHLTQSQTGDEFTRHISTFVQQRLTSHNDGTWAAADQVGKVAATMLFTHGPAFVRDTFAPIAHVLPHAVADYLSRISPAADALSTMILDMSDATNAFEIVGFDVPPSVLESFRPYLPRIEQDRDYPEWTWGKGFTALALNERAVWAPIAGYLPDQEVAFVPKATFGANVQGLLAYLGAARVNGATFADVAPAWRSFMESAGSLFSARQIEHVLVLWVARIVCYDIGREPLGHVAELLHAEIQRCVAAGF